LDPREGGIVNDARTVHGDMLAVRLGTPCLIVHAIEDIPANVGTTAQHLIDELDVELSALAQAIAVAVEIFDRGLNAERAGLAVALKVELERQAHDLGLLRVHFQRHLAFVGTALICPL